MFGLEDSRRYYVCQRYVRMNMGINGLSKIVGNELKQPLLGGDVFIFFGKSRQMVKLLCWDGDGFLLYQKRLEKGTCVKADTLTSSVSTTEQRAVILTFLS